MFNPHALILPLFRTIFRTNVLRYKITVNEYSQIVCCVLRKLIYKVKMMNVNRKGTYFGRWFLVNLLCLYHLSPVKSLNAKNQPYLVINMPDDTESLLKTSEKEHTKEEINPQVSRRGYAGEDFYQKAAKNIPRMGRRGGNEGQLADNVQLYDEVKRPYSEQQVPEEALWPWHTDRVPTYIKRENIIDNCQYWPKIEKFITEEFCNDNFACCAPLKGSSILKRVLQTYSSKQTFQKPDYKNNQYMK